jgi:hypothetical protein
MVRATDAGALVGSSALGALSVLHFAWAVGSTWPVGDESDLSEIVAGTPHMPGRGACLMVGGALGAASLTVAGLGERRPIARITRAGIAVGFLARGMAGLSGDTRRLVSWTPSPRFVRLDRHYYGPLCLMISAATAASVPGRPKQTS